MTAKKDEARSVFATNRAARFHYLIVDRIETGMVLTGAEVKSVRAGKVVLKDAFATIKEGEVFLHNVHISPYIHARASLQDPDRSRKLLLHRREITKLEKQTNQEGFTLIPVQLHLNNGRIKCVLGIGKGKKMYDKRAASKERSAKREIRAAYGRRRKGS
ncbi:MAG: SsrA-binding protein SmpB [Acidobacteriota bacterium]